ncbi:MAG: hypothetical protein NTY30_04935 [Candidatus Berkelbacteria bacterium]|nr:hypothetical protein [Candidatus Berkelbacteria bacterium]
MADDIAGITDQGKIDGLSFDQVVGGDIFELVGLELSDEERDQLATKMFGAIQLRVFERINSELDESGRADFKSTLETGDNNAITSFFENQNIDFTAITAEEAAKYKIEFITFAKMIEKSGGTLADILLELDKDKK